MVALCRACVTKDGRIKASFDDNSILLLNAAGSSFVMCSSDGSSTMRQLSEYALTRHAAQLSVVLEFRNMHVEQPFMCRSLLKSGAATRQGLSLGYQLKEVWWPGSAQEVVDSGLVHVFPDGRISMAALDGSARIVLHGHRRRFAVCYPLLVEDQPFNGRFDYVWQTQVFALQGYPTRWHAAVQLLLSVVQLLDGLRQGGASMMAADNGQDSMRARQQSHVQACTSNLQGALVLDDVPQHGRSSSTVLPVTTDGGLCGVCDNFQPGTWWFEPNLTLLPHDEVVVLEWTTDATYQFHPATGEVEAWIHIDESCLSSTREGRFVQHIRPSGRHGPCAEQLYAATSVPDSVWAQPPAMDGQQVVSAGQRYRLGQIAAHALKLREQMAAANALAKGGGMSAGPNASIEASFVVASEQVAERVLVPEQGELTAYADGRIRVSFTDRAILHMNSSHSHCKVFLPDGKCIVVATAHPVGVDMYVQAAVEFATWAFKSPGQRENEARMQARIEAEAAAAQRTALLLDMHASRSLPASRDSTVLDQSHKASSSAAIMPAPLDYDLACTTKLASPKSAIRPPVAAGSYALGLGHDAQGGAWAREDSMQAKIAQLLSQNAELLQRL